MVSKRSITLLVATITVLLVTGCSASGPEWTDNGGAYTTTNVRNVFKGVGESSVQGKPVSEVSDLRHAALVELRKRGDGAADAADLVTKTFPADAGVPIYLERATFEGKPDSLVVVEMIGQEDGSLDHMRLWVVSDAGDILFSAVR